MKRFAMEAASIIIAATATGCGWMPEDSDGQGKIVLRATSTKSDGINVDDFILTLTGEGKTLYSGRFGDRPAEMTAPAGDYRACLQSGEFTAPQFDAPLMSDTEEFTLEAGETKAVDLLCTLQNAGLRLTFTNNFKKVYPEGPLKLTQGGGSLEYAYDCQQTAYFNEGTVFISYDSEIIAVRELQKGVVESLEMDGENANGGAVFSARVEYPLPEKATAEKITSLPVLSVSQTKTLPPSDSLLAKVSGYIVGGVKSSKFVRAGSSGYDISSNILLADNAADSTLAACLPVELKTQAAQAALSLAANPEYAGRRVCVSGKAVTYFGTVGLKSVTAFMVE